MTLLSRRDALTVAASGALALIPRGVWAQAKKTVTIAIQLGTSHLATTVADKQALFAKHAAANGIGDTQFVIQRVSGSPAINDGIFSGNIDVGAYGPTALLAAWLKTKGSFGLHGIAACNDAVLALYTNNPAIKSVADIKSDDRIAVTATTAPQAVLLRMAAEKSFGAGQASRFDKQMVALPHPDATSALISGAVSLYFAAPPFISALEASGKCHKVIDGNDVIGGPYSGALLAATTKFATANPAAIVTIVAALREAMALIASEPRKAAEIYMSVERTSLGIGDVERAIRAQIFTVEPHGIGTFAAFMARTGQLKQAPSKWQDVFFPPINQGKGS
jgi:NitT/TauT family transport system substrate-binding protein